MRARFAKIGIEAGKPFALDKLTAEQKAELETGMKSGLEKIKAEIATFGKDENGWRVATSGFGDRQVVRRRLDEARRRRDGGNLRQRRRRGAVSAARHRQRRQEARYAAPTATR